MVRLSGYGVFVMLFDGGMTDNDKTGRNGRENEGQMVRHLEAW